MPKRETEQNNRATMPMYTFVNKLGQGAFGKVYLLKTPDLKEFAVKSVKTSDIGEEAKIMLCLHHPNIVACFHSFSKESYTYLITEFCDGGTLTNFIYSQPRPIDEQTVVNMLWEIASALEYLHHEKKIYHRDLKPDNILLTGPTKTVKVGDIGLGSYEPRKSYLGTQHYMSPEISTSQKHTAKTDIWSLGCCVHEMMTKKYIITDLRDLDEPVVRIPCLSDDYSKRLRNLVLEGMLQTDPEMRSSAREIREAAEKFRVAQGGVIFDETEIVAVVRQGERYLLWGAIGARVIELGALALQRFQRFFTAN